MARRKRRVWRHPEAVRRTAIQRVNNGEPVVAVAQEMDLHARLLRAWVAQAREGEPAAKGPASAVSSWEGLRQENQRLKQALAEKTLEVDFYKGALQKIAARRQPHDKAGETASTPR